MQTRTYGRHLMLDGYGADRAVLADVGIMYDLLNRLPEMIGMRKIGFPHIARFTDDDIAGVSGFVMIMESHISIHTYSHRGFISLDAYSCKTFDEKIIIDAARKIYGITDMEITVVDRGKRFPSENIPD